MATSNDPTNILEKQDARTKPPPMFEVALLNDDYTPMEFVVEVLQRFFGMGREKATQVMLKVHREVRATLPPRRLNRSVNMRARNSTPCSA